MTPNEGVQESKVWDRGGNGSRIGGCGKGTSMIYDLEKVRTGEERREGECHQVTCMNMYSDQNYQTPSNK